MDPPTYPFEETSFMNGPLSKLAATFLSTNRLTDQSYLCLSPEKAYLIYDFFFI